MLKSLQVENFGPFRDKHSFNLNVESSDKGLCKPLIVFGGKNGTGKTTLLEAIKVCLFGDFFPGKRMPRRKYDDYLRARLHRTIDGTLSSHASVRLVFSYSSTGYVHDFSVERSWKPKRSHVSETLQIRQDDQPLHDLTKGQWQDFIMELIPPGLSKLFFFDGEQIQGLAQGAENTQIFRSINSLLGLDLVERLHSDLKIYLSRRARGDEEDLEAKITEYKRRESCLEQQLDLVVQRESSLQEEIDKLEYEVEACEQQIAAEGGGYAVIREELKAQSKRLDESIEQLEGEIRELCSNLLPFAYVPDLCLSLKNRLQQEEREQQRTAAVTYLNKSLDDLVRNIDEMKFADSISLPREQKIEVIGSIVSELRNKINSTNIIEHRYIHPMSSEERAEITKWLDISIEKVPFRLRELSRRYEGLIRNRRNIQSQLLHVPDDDVLKPLLEKLGDLNKRIGVLHEQRKSFEEEERKTKNEITQVERDLTKNIESRIRQERESEQIALVDKIQQALREYSNRLKQEKIGELCSNLLDCLNFLFRKKMIQRIEINPVDFQITIFNGSDAILPKSELSAGEKQVYAIALLWALARTSGRPFPFIIDTPLGRLDNEHRRNIVQNFLPNASHQVIVFSTDTEIDQGRFSELKRYIAGAYHLEYDVNKGATQVNEGYFWKEMEGIAIR